MRNLGASGVDWRRISRGSSKAGWGYGLATEDFALKQSSDIWVESDG